MININKKYQQTTGLIQRLINISHFCGLVLLFEKVCLLVVQKFVLHGKQFLAKQKRGTESKTYRQIW